MAGNRLSGRVDALEQAIAPKFGGYASVWWRPDQTKAEAVAEWETENGPVGERQVVLWRFPLDG